MSGAPQPRPGGLPVLSGADVGSSPSSPPPRDRCAASSHQRSAPRPAVPMSPRHGCGWRCSLWRAGSCTEVCEMAAQPRADGRPSPSSPSPFSAFPTPPLLFRFFSPCPRGAERGRRAAPVLRMALSAAPPSAHSSSQITAGCQRNYGFGARVVQPARAAAPCRPRPPAPPAWSCGAAGRAPSHHPVLRWGRGRSDKGTARGSPRIAAAQPELGAVLQDSGGAAR